MIGPATDDPYQYQAERVCALVTLATGRVWPRQLVAAIALVIDAIAEVERGRVASTRYTPASRLRWLRGETTHQHRSPILRRLVDVHGLPEPVARELCHIVLGTARFDNHGEFGSSSALREQLAEAAVVSDRVAQRWAACLARAEAGGPVPKSVTNRLRREVDRHRCGLHASLLSTAA